jgi:hypothetical protein
MSQKQTIDIVVPPIEGGMKEMAMPAYKQASCYQTLIGKISWEIGLAKTMKKKAASIVYSTRTMKCMAIYCIITVTLVL